jgi:hypothetical protein
MTGVQELAAVGEGMIERGSQVGELGSQPAQVVARAQFVVAASEDSIESCAELVA